jgi:hypothetical protein
MNENTFNLIKDASTFLQIDNICDYRNFIKPSLSTALKIVATIEASDRELTILEIAHKTDLGTGTVSDTIRALRLGGYPLMVREAGTQGCKSLISKVQTQEKKKTDVL